ncbi:methionyl-tRNA formyltransferase [Mucilaginibacter arboris]|uniref:Methionyl-tRNA formyltransferase n=1 Tax=Mucilaginibacter arboris TaxID=2682090 RepID=A0A7K1T0W8_9SPHI|nr:methionyl-tRNA formyltransferase [Mucilaginibacter arboris]MVN23189.1 methionyl-tRNA formyltransferase [Mucilaginibacter arboris]
MKIVFMGTPEFAVASLDALIKAGMDVVAVVTAPDKPAGRGQQVSQSSVKQYAVQNNLKVLQPEKLKNTDFLLELQKLQADLQVVVAFRMLPEVVWSMPPKGTINLHASLLPDYRGAAPINWAIINGEHQTGVSTFFLKHEIDTGDIILTDKTSILETDTAGDVHDKLMKIGADLLVKTVQVIADNNFKEVPQSELIQVEETSPALKHAPKIFKDDCLVNWIQPVEKVYNFIRGLSPYPTAFTHLNDKIFKIYKAEKQITETAISAGGFLTDHKTFLKFACTDGFILVKEVQLEGKKRMNVEEFLRGVKL